MKLLSDACEYALRAVVWMAQRPEQPQKVRELAEGIHAAPGYLVKVLQALTKAGILSAQRGSRGGFTLECDPARLTVLEVVNAIDPIERILTCPLGLKSHGKHLCPMHKKIDDAMAKIEASFGSSTIQDLLNQRSRSKPLCDALSVDPG
jgi:Rrf2 family transcriptional regulator, nitric oxide-sensitive transcriptional repressor